MKKIIKNLVILLAILCMPLMNANIAKKILYSLMNGRLKHTRYTTLTMICLQNAGLYKLSALQQVPHITDAKSNWNETKMKIRKEETEEEEEMKEIYHCILPITCPQAVYDLLI